MSKIIKEVLYLLANNSATLQYDMSEQVNQALKELEAIISRQVIGYTQYPDQAKDVTYDMYIESTLQSKQRQALHVALYGEEAEL